MDVFPPSVIRHVFPACMTVVVLLEGERGKMAKEWGNELVHDNYTTDRVFCFCVVLFCCRRRGAITRTHPEQQNIGRVKLEDTRADVDQERSEHVNTTR